MRYRKRGGCEKLTCHGEFKKVRTFCHLSLNIENGISNCYTGSKY